MPIEPTPTLAGVLRAALDAARDEIHVALPGEVQSFDASRRTVDVKPLIKRGYEAEDGSRAVESLPVISGVPVVFPCGSLKGMTFPLAAGDTGLIVFSEASIARWLAHGGEVDPGDDRRHSMSDAVFYPGLTPFGSAIDGDNVVIKTDTEIHAGGTSSLLTRDEFRNFVDNFYALHTHPGITVGTAVSLVAVVGTTTGAAYPGTSVLKGA